MFKVLPVILIGLVLSICFVVGQLFAETAVADGPGSVLEMGLVAVVLMVCFGAFTGSMLWETAGFGGLKTGAVIIGIAAAVCTFWSPMTTLNTGHQTAAVRRELAPKVQAFALQHFDEIDGDHNGVITDHEMSQAVEKLPLSDQERDLLEYMQGQQSEVGHVIGSSTSTIITSVPVGNVWVPQVQAIPDYVYGISRDDLKGYADRVTEKYKLW